MPSTKNLDFFQFKDHEKVKKEGEVRKGISTFLNNNKQKLKKLQITAASNKVTVSSAQ
jgi:hypothetical protein